MWHFVANIICTPCNFPFQNQMARRDERTWVLRDLLAAAKEAPITQHSQDDEGAYILAPTTLPCPPAILGNSMWHFVTKSRKNITKCDILLRNVNREVRTVGHPLQGRDAPVDGTWRHAGFLQCHHDCHRGGHSHPSLERTYQNSNANGNDHRRRPTKGWHPPPPRESHLTCATEVSRQVVPSCNWMWHFVITECHIILPNVTFCNQISHSCYTLTCALC